MTARRGGCEHERLSTIAAVPALAHSTPTLDDAVQVVASAPPSSTPGAPGDVLGRSEAGQGGGGGGGGAGRTGPPAATPPLDLASPSTDLPFLLALLATLSLFGWLVYRHARRSKAALDDPAKVTRSRR
jgi:hypothetical protein